MSTIKDLPIDNRPREKALKYGIDKLSDYELLAILIRKGFKDNSAIQIATNLIVKYNSLENVFKQSINELTSNLGINKITALELKVISCISKKINREIQNVSKSKIESPIDVYDIMINKYYSKINEIFVVFYLNRHNKIIYEELLSIGNEKNVVFNSKLICKNTIEKMASKVIISHNHPSGDSRASKDDINAYCDLKNALKFLNVELIDHIVIGDKQCYSIKFEKLYKIDL